MRADAAGTNTVEVRKGLGLRLTTSILASVAVAVAIVPLMAAGAAWGFVAGAILVALVLGVDAALVADKILNPATVATSDTDPYDLAA